MAPWLIPSLSSAKQQKLHQLPRSMSRGEHSVRLSWESGAAARCDPHLTGQPGACPRAGMGREHKETPGPSTLPAAEHPQELM